jgi:hypothetical protein
MDGNGEVDLRDMGCEDGNRINRSRIEPTVETWY